MVEEKEARLYSLFPPGSKSKSKLIMLKICNSLLRRLSKSHNTGTCVRAFWLFFKWLFFILPPPRPLIIHIIPPTTPQRCAAA